MRDCLRIDRTAYSPQDGGGRVGRGQVPGCGIDRARREVGLVQDCVICRHDLPLHEYGVVGRFAVSAGVVFHQDFAHDTLLGLEDRRDGAQHPCRLGDARGLYVDG